MLIAHSTKVDGIALASTGPWGCALDEGLTRQTGRYCIMDPGVFDLQEAYHLIHKFVHEGSIDSYEGLKNKPVLIYHSKNDSLIDENGGKQNEIFFKHYEARVKTIFGQEFEHGWPTLNEGGPCNETNQFLVNKCNFDLAKSIIEFLYSVKIQSSESQKTENLKEFEQKEAIGLSRKGFIYTPHSCMDKQCPIHFHLHGCGQSFDQIGDIAVKYSEFNEIAEEVGIIIVYPQTFDYMVEEENGSDGCWDFMGYSVGENKWEYLTKEGKQIKFLMDLYEEISQRKTGQKEDL